MNIQYPYYLYLQQSHTEVKRNDEGDFVEKTSVPDWVFVCKCRDEVNSEGSVVTQINGENIHFHATIYAPKGIEILPFGTKVLVSKNKINDLSSLNNNSIETELSNGGIRIVDIVKGVSQSRLNTRIWV